MRIHAHFILATTDPEKIIETVRSRCFTLFFDAIDAHQLAEHLAYLCQQEQITYTSDALLYIARCAEGSARDAINMLETIRFSYPTIDKSAVLQLLGHVDDQQLVLFIIAVMRGDTVRFLTSWSDLVARVSPTHLWQGLLRLVRSMIWHHNGVTAQDVDSAIIDSLKVIPLSAYTLFMAELYKTEPIFIRTSDQRGLIEFMLLQLCARFKKNSGGSSQNQSTVAQSIPESYELLSDDDGVVEDSEEGEEEDEDIPEEALIIAQQRAVPIPSIGEQPSGSVQRPDDRFALCRQQFALLPEPILASMISQVVSIAIDAEQKKAILHFAEHHTFFADSLGQATAVWHPVIKMIYGDLLVITYQFDIKISAPTIEKKVVQPAARVQTQTVRPVVEQTPKATIVTQSPMRTATSSWSPQYKRVQAPLEKKIDVSDAQRWPVINRVLTYFPGTVTLVEEAR